MRYRVGAKLGYEAKSEATLILNIRVARTQRQRIVNESLTVTPDAAVESFEVPETGNRYDRLALRPGLNQIDYGAEVELDAISQEPGTIGETGLQDLPFIVLPHLYPSRFCPSDRLAPLAHRLFDAVPPGHGRVTTICNWIHDQTLYERGSSHTLTTALDTLVDRAGVCRDFAHLGIALCRGIGIPARFASAYAMDLQPPDFHAVFEAWLDGRWWLFDATRQASLDGMVRIGVGRDAGDTSFATFAGDVVPQNMSVSIEALDAMAPGAGRTIEAVSISEI